MLPEMLADSFSPRRSSWRACSRKRGAAAAQVLDELVHLEFFVRAGAAATTRQEAVAPMLSRSPSAAGGERDKGRQILILRASRRRSTRRGWPDVDQFAAGHHELRGSCTAARVFMERTRQRSSAWAASWEEELLISIPELPCRSI